MTSRLECKNWWSGLSVGSEDLEILYKIYDILAVRVVQELIGKSAPKYAKGEACWPMARIHNVVGGLCMRHEGLDLDQVIRYVTLCHNRKQPVTEQDQFPPAYGEVLVEDYLRQHSEDLFTPQGRRRLHSFAKEVGLSSVDLFGAVAVLVHKLADELATCCGGPEAHE